MPIFLTIVKSRVFWLAVLAAAIFGVVRYWTNEVAKVNTLQTQVEQKTQQLENTKDTLDKTTSSEKIDEKVNLEAVTAIRETSIKQEGIVAKVRTKVATIVQTYNAKPRTVDNQNSESIEISQTRIDGLWEAYCAGMTTATECQKTKE